MSFSGLSAIGPGMQQGQMNLQTLQAKAQQIQKAQMAIDASKRELQAQASLFQGLPQQAQPPGNASPGQPPMGQQPMGGGQPGMGAPQPPMPGQSSQPMQPPGGMPPPPGGMPGQPPMGPQGAPQGGPPPGGQMQPPPQGGPGAADLSPQAQMQLLTQIAQGIKQRSPGIDPLTLFEAVKQQIGLMGALSNTQKQQLVFAADQIKAQVSERNTDVRADTSARNTDVRADASRDIAGGHDRTSERNTDVRSSAMLQATQARIADADNRLNQTQAAINARQDKSISGRATAKVQTERLSLLKTQLSQAKQKLSAASASGDQTAMAAAQQGVDAAYNRVLDFQKKVSGPQGAGGPPPPDGGGQRGPSPASLNGKPIWPEGDHWVYEDGTEAK